MSNLVFRQAADGKTYAQQAPAPEAPVCGAAGASAEAKGAGRVRLGPAAGREYYQGFVPPGSFRSVYSGAMADFMKPPQVVAAGLELRVLARKSCRLTTMWVRLLVAAGQVLEKGAAIPAANW
ncbi:MAG: hypothetical protein EOO63_01865 [Hymenobacter sp.]|nr:MAG: hypothetical protein EOO63_01865 [Hymenobacter sp.]